MRWGGSAASLLAAGVLSLGAVEAQNCVTFQLGVCCADVTGMTGCTERVCDRDSRCATLPAAPVCSWGSDGVIFNGASLPDGQFAGVDASKSGNDVFLIPAWIDWQVTLPAAGTATLTFFITKILNPDGLSLQIRSGGALLADVPLSQLTPDRETTIPLSAVPVAGNLRLELSGDVQSVNSLQFATQESVLDKGPALTVCQPDGAPTATPIPTSTVPPSLSQPLDVDRDGEVQVSTDIVYITRHLLGFNDVVPPTFRILNDQIPSDAEIAANIDALKNGQVCP